MMDTTSGEALRQLYRQINQLECEKGEVKKREGDLHGEVAAMQTVGEEKDGSRS